MALSVKLEFRQSQSLVMTPQLQQAIKLLQLSNLELNEFVNAELERNPLLERKEQEEGAPLEPQDDRPGDISAKDQDKKDGSSQDGDKSESVNETTDSFSDLASESGQQERVSDLDSNFDDVYPDAGALAPSAGLDSGWQQLGSGGGRGFDSSDNNLEAYVAETISLRDHLVRQLHLTISDPVQLIIGQYLIDMIDDTGYLRSDLEELADQLGTSLEVVERTLHVMQAFEPSGVFARDIGECLAIQLYDQGDLTPLMQTLCDHLELLGTHKIKELKRAVGVDMDELGEMIAHIRQLNPKPGHEFDQAMVQPIVPDVFVRQISNGGWHVELNSETLPRILVNRTYYTTVSKGARSSDDKTYLSECLNTANWLTKSLDQRARTILKVAQEVVRQQDAFFVHGIEYLRPLNLKTVAEAIEMHESTVSRVTSNKYIGTPRGVFELKYFFTSAIASSENGEAYSSESVRYKIKQLIDAEPATKVLSDDKIVTLLRDDGVDIARRTVAKYREALHIPSSVQRRRQKKMELAQAG
ncbi:MAG: RNA polymerase factor sigma-54 [bacterium]|nr:RNA polymerase factor sigma-54 [bacterium]